MKVTYTLLAFTFLLFVHTTEAALTPKWLANNLRHLSFYPELFWFPGVSRLWSISMGTYLYLFIMTFFGRQDLVVGFFNDLVTTYYPMTGVSSVTFP